MVRTRHHRPPHGGGSKVGFYIALAILVLLGAGAIGWQIMRPRGAPVRRVAATAAQAQGYFYGDSNAPVQIIEFGDFQCPACAQYTAVTEPDVRARLLDSGRASFVFYDFPLPNHKNSVAASNAAACADEQGKFWPMHDRLYLEQPAWRDERNPKGIFQGFARAVGLDMTRWSACYDERRYQPRIDANLAEGERRDVRATPTFVIGSRQIPGAIGYDAIKAYVDTALAEAKQSGGTRASGASTSGASTSGASASGNPASGTPVSSSTPASTGTP